MILLIDNYDSFAHNLGRYFTRQSETVRIVRNNQISISEIKALAPKAIVISPGPCAPDQAGITLELIAAFAPTTPILGVCLGHQAIGQVFGGKVVRAVRPLHGEASAIDHDGQGVFQDLPSPMQGGRYHSLVVDAQDAPDLIVTARDEDGMVMALRHKTFPCYGVQFHPESILTPHGAALLQNFRELAEKWTHGDGLRAA
jgi:anthranilate synthase/aminodeoxychorismate synthase-like glutamine amidotransferase